MRKDMLGRCSWKQKDSSFFVSKFSMFWVPGPICVLWIKICLSFVSLRLRIWIPLPNPYSKTAERKHSSSVLPTIHYSRWFIRYFPWKLPNNGWKLSYHNVKSVDIRCSSVIWNLSIRCFSFVVGNTVVAYNSSQSWTLWTKVQISETVRARVIFIFSFSIF